MGLSLMRNQRSFTKAYSLLRRMEVRKRKLLSRKPNGSGSSPFGLQLDDFKHMLMEMFRACPTEPHLAIGIDRSPSFTIFGTAVTKRSPDILGSPRTSKRASIPCKNWNLGNCDSPCSNRRRHDVCSECSGTHRAKDSVYCLATLNRRRKRRTFRGFGTSERSGRGASSSSREAKCLSK